MRTPRWIVSACILVAGCMPGADERRRIIEAAGRDDLAALGALLQERTALDFHALDGLTPLINAARNGATGAVRLLLARGADPNYRGDSTTTPAYWAAINCHRDAYELIAAAGGHVALPDFARSGFSERVRRCGNAALEKAVLEAVAAEDTANRSTRPASS